MLKPREKVIEDFGLYFEGYMLPRSLGRIYGALMIANEPVMGLDQLAGELGISKASASTTVRQLHGFQLIEKISLPGDRRDYYRVAPDAHIKYLQRSLNGALGFVKLIEAGAALDDLTPAVQLKLERILHLYEALEVAIKALFDEYSFPEAAPTKTSRKPSGKRAKR